MSVNEFLGWGFVAVILYGVALLSIDKVVLLLEILSFFVVEAILSLGLWLRDRGESLRQWARRTKLRFTR
jgi:hypothetical protein